MQCARCHQENPERARFCLECGNPFAQVCTACGAELPSHAKFCPSCGRSVEGAASPAAPARSPEAYTPRHLAEKILTSRGALEGERKPVTVLFCDLVGSTVLAERLGPDVMHVLLNRFFELALAEVHRFEGTINQFLGDGFMALFGAPLAYEDHARRAVLAALGIGRSLRERPLDVAAGAEVRLTVRMGLHTGLVVVGAIGDNLRMDYTAVGDTTHLAARLQQLAEPDAILISEATARLVEGYVRLDRLGPVPVKGKTEPVTVFKVTGVGPRRSALEGLESRALSRFVGRERELTTLIDLFTQIERGQGQVVGIVGEPGVGKSRLLLEFRRSLGARRVTHLQGRCLSYGSAIPYVPLIDIVRANCGIAENDTLEATAEKVRFGLLEVGLDAADAAPCLLHLLGVKEGTDALGVLDPEAVKSRTFETLRQMSLLGSWRRPLVLEIEDLHWIDRTSEEYLGFLTEGLGGAPILLLGTYRPGYRPPWVEKSFATQVSLARLTPTDSLSIVRSVLPEADPGDPLAQLILAKAEGNPFFLEELARVVGDQGGLRAELPVPDTVHGVLMARIDRLADEPKRVLQTASVLGREFSTRLLEAIWDSPGALASSLRELTGLEFLYQRTGSGEPVYVFKHALTQDVAESTLVAGRRRELHRRAAEALGRLYPERVEELAPLLAHHYVEAEAWAPAAEHARRAAEAARAAYANQEALARYDQAVLAAERGSLPPVERLRLHEGRAAVHTVLGAFEPARADLESALDLARQSADATAEARLLGGLGALWGGHKDYQRGLDLARQAVTLIEGSGDRQAIAEARVRVGTMLANLARVAEGRRELERALGLFREVGDGPGQARTLDVLAMTTALAGDVAQSVAYAEEAIPRLRAIGDRQTEASCALMAGASLAYGGEIEASRRWMRQALDTAIAIGARALESFVRFMDAQMRELFGDFGGALTEASAALALARDIGHLEWMAGSLSVIGRVRRQCGDLAGARRAHEEMLATTQALGTALWLADALGELGEDLAGLGEEAAAADHLARAVETGGEAIEFVIRPLLAQAALWLRMGCLPEALDAARRVQERAPQFRVFLADACRLEGEALAALGQRESAGALLRRAKADATAMGAAPARWRAALALARLADEIGRPVEAEAERAEALELLQAVMAGLPDPELRRSLDASEVMRQARGR